ncbi:MAG: acyltransferase [Alphaproteobacteria bacterium]|nr:acyltransferase [Alphaproteobacteria bacterium]
MKPSTQPYLPYIDGLRAFAVASVVVYHAWPQLLPGGFIGVDVFFVISGFLITRLLAADMQAGDFSYFGFLVRRIRRLAPAAAVCFAAVTVLGAMVFLPDAYEEFGRSLTAASAMFANFYFHGQAGYFSPPAYEMPLLHTWSLAVEDQFYLIWPLLLVSILKFRSRYIPFAIVAGLGVVSFAHAEASLSSDADYAFYMLAPRAWELLIGALLAFARPVSLRPVIASGLSVLGMAMIVASTLLLSRQSHFPGLNAAPACIGTALVIVSGLGQRSLGARIFSWRPLVFVGLISYSLYLWHWPLFTFARYYAGRALTDIELSGLVIASTLIAALSWRYVETPFRRPRIRHKNNARAAMASGVAAMALLATSGVIIRELDGVPMRFSGPVGQMFSDMSHGNPMRHQCDGFENISRNDSECNFGRRKADDGSYDVALFGDSNADHFTPLIADWARDGGLAGRQATQTQCGPVLGSIRTALPRRITSNCERYHQAVLEFVEDNPELKLVILSANWPSYNGALAPNRAISEGALEMPESNSFDAYMRNLVAFFVERNIMVLIIERIPHYDALPVRCIVRSLESDESTTLCGLERARATSGQNKTLPVFEAIADDYDSVFVIDPTAILCSTELCLPMKNGVFLYRDGGHLNRAGAVLLRDYFQFPPIGERPE